MKLVFDLDDTVCMTDEYSELYINNFIKENNLNFTQVAKVVRYADAKFSWTEEEAINWYKNYGDKMMAEFPCKPNAIEIINSLYIEGHQIVIATARNNDWHNDPEKTTKEWLKINNINYDKIYLGRVDKEKICEEEDADVFVDDDLDITKNVAEVFKNKKGKVVFLMSSEYNKAFKESDGVIRIESFQDMIKKLKELNML